MRQIDWNDWERLGEFWFDGINGDIDGHWTEDLFLWSGWYADLGDAEREPDVYAIVYGGDESIMETFATRAEAMEYANSRDRYQEPDGEDL